MAEQINCFGSCVDNLTTREFDQISDNVHNTLTHPKGNQLFESYLQQKQLKDSLKCLEMYNTCISILRNSSEESLASLIAQVKEVQEMGEDMTEIDVVLEQQIEEALEERNNTKLVKVLEEIKVVCQNHLYYKHKGFVAYIMHYKKMT